MKMKRLVVLALCLCLSATACGTIQVDKPSPFAGADQSSDESVSDRAEGSSSEGSTEASSSESSPNESAESSAEVSSSESSPNESAESSAEAPSSESSTEESTESSVDTSSLDAAARTRDLQETFSVLLAKKQELQNGVSFVVYDPDNANLFNRYYYCDANIEDINHDGDYEMIVKYIVPQTVAGMSVDDEDNFSTCFVVYDIYTVQEGKAVSSGHIDIHGITNTYAQN